MRKALLHIVRQYFSNFYYFYKHLRYKIFIFLFLSIIASIMDGFGLAMFLPLFKLISDDAVDHSSVEMGNLSFLVDGMKGLGLEINLVTILGILLFFFVMKGVVKIIAGYLQVVYRQFFIRTLRTKNLQFLASYSYSNFVLADAGKIQNTLSGEIGRVVSAYTTYMQVIKSSVTLIVYCVLALLSNPQFAILVAVGGYLTNFIFRKMYVKTKQLSRDLVKTGHGMQGLLIQHIEYFKYLKATGLMKIYSGKLIKKVHELEETNRKIGVIDAIMQGLREPTLIFVVVVVILIQVELLGGSMGLIILSILFFYRALTQVMQLQTAWNQFLSYSGSIENLTGFTADLVAGKEKLGKKKFEGLQNFIKFENVNFSYGNVSTLKNINLGINKYETIAFVGESGSGKSTLMNLICGMLIPNSGRILVDDVALSEFNTHSFSQRIGYITQEPVIFDDTIFNNVTFWSEKTPENYERFFNALKKASIDNFVLEQELKEDSRLGHNGINLSGGQKQRFSIARELYKDIDILIMDEATSALDSETEKTIQTNIEALKGNYTILIVAHRLSTIKNSDRIVVLKKGEVMQIGTYEELIKLGTDFKKMVELQEL